MMGIEEKRRELFEAFAEGQGYNLEYNDLTIYESGATRCAWSGFNAALDSVLIELPSERSLSASDDPWYVRGLCINAIESTGLGIKVMS